MCHAGLLAVRREAIDLGPPPRLPDVCLDLGQAVGMGQLGDQEVFGSEDHERRTEQRVRPGREDADQVAARLVVVGGDLEVDLGALRPADPVGLHDAYRLGPVEAREVEQLVGIRGRAQEPLLEVALLDERAAAPAVPVGTLDLLARQGAVVGTPVDRRQGAVRQPSLEQAQEQPLVPHVVRRVGRDDLVLPVEGRAHRPELAAHVLDVLQRPGERVTTVLDRGVLGRQAERVEADGEEDVEAMHPPEPGQRVARGHDVPVPDVQVARRVRVHGQEVVLGPGLVEQVGLVHLELGPARLPARFDGARVVALDPGAGPGRLRGGGIGGVGHVGPRRRDTPRRAGEG